ncbi:MAG: class I SAM-dependent methyltransferase [Myxococcales bacterium]|nr:MAG: class I SAM-dependent methyltransferase [Myxococcales bacterium]
MKSFKVETRPQALREAMMPRVHRRLSASGKLSLPAAPALLETYVEQIATQFSLLGRRFSTEQLDHLRRILRERLEAAWKRSPHCRLLIDWSTDASPAVSVSYTVATRFSTTEDEYEEWTRTRTPPLFGANPDAKVMAVAGQLSLGMPALTPCLDIGAGTGRNSLPLARLGHPVDAVEVAPALLGLLRDDLRAERLPVTVMEGDVLGDLALPARKYRLAFLCEVLSSFREPAQLRPLFERAVAALQPGGQLLFSAFIAHDSYVPDRLARELSEVFWCTIYTRKDIAAAMAGLPLKLVSDESVHDYEKANLPPGAWPQTEWYPQWTQGLDVFAIEPTRSPAQLRWLLYQRDGEG